MTQENYAGPIASGNPSLDAMAGAKKAVIGSTLAAVMAFHEAFGLRGPTEPKLPGNTEDEVKLLTEISNELTRVANICHDLAAQGQKNLNFLRLQLIVSEVAELAQALADEDVVETLDALTDITYVVDGSYDSFGLAPLKMIAFTEVHESNMSKLGDDGKPILNSSGRVVKGPNYVPPNLDKIVNDHLKELIEQAKIEAR